MKIKIQDFIESSNFSQDEEQEDVDGSFSSSDQALDIGLSSKKVPYTFFIGCANIEKHSLDCFDRPTDRRHVLIPVEEQIPPTTNSSENIH
jgi:hypothetical protein